MVNWKVFGFSLGFLAFLCVWAWGAVWLTDFLYSRYGKKASTVGGLLWVILWVALFAGLVTGNSSAWIYGGAA